MGKKTGKKTQILLKLDEDPELLQMFEQIKKEIKIHSNVDVVRTLIQEKHKQLQKEKKIP